METEKSSASRGNRLSSLHQLEEKCVREYRKYADTVAVSYAVYNLFTKNPEIANFVGIEHKLKNIENTDIRPDIVVTYENDQKGMIFELKWSLPLDDELLEREIRGLRRYAISCSNWRKPSDNVDFHDLVLICHIDDAQRTVDIIKRISNESNCDFLKKEGFAVWSWTITAPKKGQRKEELRLFPVYGKTRNRKVETLIRKPGGILFPEDVLTFLRFSFTFVREKPPVQYTMTVLVQNIFPSFQQKPYRDYYKIHTDLIYERAKIFFPSWHEFDAKTIQIKRGWIREALGKLLEINLCEKMLGKPDWWSIPIPTLQTKKPFQTALCRKTSQEYLKRTKKRRAPGRPRVRPLRHKRQPSEKPLNGWMK